MRNLKEIVRDMDGASAVDDVDRVFCAAKDAALLVVLGVSIGERDAIAACAGCGWEKRTIGADLCRLVRAGGKE